MSIFLGYHRGFYLYFKVEPSLLYGAKPIVFHQYQALNFKNQKAYFNTVIKHLLIRLTSSLCEEQCHVSLRVAQILINIKCIFKVTNSHPL